MAQVYVSIGSNIKPRVHIQAGLADMQQHFGIITQSATYENAAVGFDGDNFLNLVVRFNTQMDIFTVAKNLRLIEKNNGRQRTSHRFCARTLDLDIILYDDLIYKDETIEVPRAEITKYAFVLLPLAEIAPNAKHPLTGQSYADLWQAYPKTSELWRVDLFPRDV